MYLSTNVYLPTDMNTMSNQWYYLHKNIIFFVIILISRHILFRLMQKYISPMITNCLSCCVNCLVLLAKHIVSIHSSHHICMALKFYNHMLQLLWGSGGNSHKLRYGMCHFFRVLFGWKINFGSIL